MGTDVRSMIEGYERIKQEIAVARKYGTDYYAQRGKWTEAVERLHPRRLQLRVAAIIKETDQASTLRLVADQGQLPPFQAGQYINLTVNIDGIRTGRAYSISSSPAQTAYYDITVRRIANGFVSDYLLDKTAVGDVFESSGPAGHFYYNPLFHGDDLVFLAGGSGITPFMSMIREVTDRGLSRRIHLIYGCRTPRDAIFHDELLDRSQRCENFSYDLVISEPAEGYAGLSGLIDAGLVTSLAGPVQNKTYYLCGPQAMYDFCLGELKQLGIPGRRIRHEVFSPPQVYKDPAWPQEIKPDTIFRVSLSSGRKINARAGEPLLTSLERAGLAVENSCRSGECSLCRVKLLSGQVFQPPQVLLRKSDRQVGYIHSCAAYPLSDVEILL